jgi:hypothetical protein
MNWKTLESKLKAWLRGWLALDVTKKMYWDLREDLTSWQMRVEELERLQQQSAENFQRQIDALSNTTQPATEPEEEPAQIMPGHVPWSQRKRQYIESKRAPAMTPTGQQIEENSRLIASGVKQEPK